MEKNMSVPKGKRNQSRFEAQHHFFQLRADITDLILNDFGFSPEKYAAKMEKYKENHMNSPDLDGLLKRWEKKNESFSAWFVDEEAREILHLLREIERNFTMGNSIYPGEGPSKLFEFIERRKYINRAIGLCYTLKQEINYVLKTLPVDFNKYKRFAESIDTQISLYKGVRKADNRMLKPKKGEMPGEVEAKASNVFDIVAMTMREIGQAMEDEE